MSNHRSIKVVNVAHVAEGQYVVGSDDDSLTTDAEVNAAYDAEEQDWQLVLRANHKADVSQLTLAMHEGTEWTSGWGDGDVWTLVNEDGTAVTDD